MESLNGSNGHGIMPGRDLTGGAATSGTVPGRAPIGEIVDTSVANFMAQACQLNVAPPFGGFVKVMVPERTIFGVVYAIHTGSLEPGGRPVLRGREGMRDKAIFDQNPDLEQLLRTEFSALIVGYQEGSSLRSYLPPSPPPLHWSVTPCDRNETAMLTRRLDYLRTILAAGDAPVDALLAANVRIASEASANQSEFRLKAGRELATLLKHDYPRLTSILRALVD